MGRLDNYGKFMSIDEVSSALMLDKDHVYWLLENKFLYVFKANNRCRIPKSSVQKYLDYMESRVKHV